MAGKISVGKFARCIQTKLGEVVRAISNSEPISLENDNVKKFVKDYQFSHSIFEAEKIYAALETFLTANQYKKGSCEKTGDVIYHRPSTQKVAYGN